MNNNQSHNDRFEELCAAYVLTALNADEQRAFESMLDKAGEQEQQTFLGLRSAANQLAFSVERAEPSAAVKKRVMDEIQQPAPAATPISTATPREEEDSKTGYNRFTLSMAASFALLLITLALLFYAFNLNSDLNKKEAKITKLASQVQQKEQMLSILGARHVDLVVMNGLEVNPAGYGKVIWDADKQQALLQVSNLPAVPAGKAYELWLIKGNTPMPSGVFAVNNSSKNAFFKIEQMAHARKQNASSFAITLEPKGGSPTGKPTGDMYLLGNVNKNSDS